MNIEESFYSRKERKLSKSKEYERDNYKQNKAIEYYANNIEIINHNSHNLE